MTDPSFERVEELFHAAVALPTEQRAVYLDEACNGDTSLRAAVEDLLHFDDAPTQLDRLLVSPIERDAHRLREPGPRPPKIPGYDILAELGRGGMGVVYKARHLALGRTVALKMLLPGALATASQIERFRAEAATLARLSLPNVVPVFDIGECDGTPFFTMEYVEGPSLAQTLTGHPRDVRASTRLVETLARAMASVHESGIVHRDLKPANILLANDDTPKITDFGVAKDRTAERDLTGTGLAVGTPRYMAPEQATRDRGPVGPAADIYALGSILYELLIGRTPFDAGSVAETVAQLLTDDPVSPARLRPSLPRDLVTVCMKCLEKAAVRRYATAAELADDLRRFAAGEPVRARPAGRAERFYRWCRRRPLVAGLTALSAALAMALVAMAVVYNARLQAALALAEDRVVKLNVTIAEGDSASGDHFAAALRLAEALRLGRDSPELASNLRARLLEELRQGPSLTHARSFDGTIVAAVRTPEGWRIAVDGGSGTIDIWDAFADRRIGEPLKFGRPVAGAAFSADGRWLAVVANDGRLSAYDLQSGRSYEVPRQDRGAVASVAFHPESPILLARHADASFALWDVTPTGPEAIRHPANGAATAVSDDARWVVVADASGRGRLWDVAARKDVRELTPHAAPRMARPHHRLAISPDGHATAAVNDGACVRLWRNGTGELTAELPRPEKRVEHVSFGPGGREVISTDAAGDLRLWDAATGRPVAPPLHHDGSLACVALQAPAFRGGAGELVAVSRGGVVRVWKYVADPTYDTRTIDELVALTQVLACRRIDADQRVTTLNRDQWWSVWNQVAVLRDKPRTSH